MGVGNTSLTITNLCKFLKVANTTTLSYEHTQLCTDPPVDQAPSSPYAPNGEDTLKGDPQSSEVSCSPHSTGPAVQVALYNLLLSLFHTHKPKKCIRAVRHTEEWNQAQALVDTTGLDCALCQPHTMAGSKFTSFSGHCSCHSLKSCLEVFFL